MPHISSGCGNNWPEPHGFRIHFVGHTDRAEDIPRYLQWGFDATVAIRLYDVFKKDFSLWERMNAKFQRIALGRGRHIDYGRASRHFCGEEEKADNCYPTLIPNWGPLPQVGKCRTYLSGLHPRQVRTACRSHIPADSHKEKEKRIVFLKSWNEWGEGNYMEPDLKFGRGYLEALKQAIEKVF